MFISDQLELTQANLVDIVARASYLYELIDQDFLEIDTHQINQHNESNHRLKSWCEIVAQGNWEKFKKRLQWDNLNLTKINTKLNFKPLVTNPNLPSWALILEKIIETSLKQSRGILDWETKHEQSQLLMPIDPENSLPFEDLLLPGVYVARQTLLAHLDYNLLEATNFILDQLDPKAYFKLEQGLLESLTSLCEKTLEFEFSRFRPKEYHLLNLLVTDSQVTLPKKYYHAFVQQLLQDGMLNFFQNYPVLARLITTQIEFWAEATAEFLHHLKADSIELYKLFQFNVKFTDVEKTDNSQFLSNFSDLSSNGFLGKIIDIKPNLSDPHHRGRRAIALTFESGLKLIYKPKDLGLEVAYNQILNWCNQQFSKNKEQKRLPELTLSTDFPPLSDLPFKTIMVLNRQTYGWVEYVEQLPVEDEAAAKRFYQRTGMLLCLLYVLGTTDCHYENVIASGEHLVLVDLETLMQHEARLEDFPEQLQQVAVNRSLLNQQFLDSVLRTGLLPRWDFNQDNSIAYDLSGLASADSQPSVGSVLRWKFINTDNMHRAYQTMTIPVAKNIPILNNVPLLPTNYVDDLVKGFEQMYCFLLTHRQKLLGSELNCGENSDPTPLEALQNQQVRFVFRSTKVYGVILQNTLAPEFLRNGIDRSIELDILARAFLVTDKKPHAWPILHSELRAMAQLDIPYFGTSSKSNHLTIGVEKPLNNFLVEPSYQQVIARLQKLNKTDQAQQISMIKGTFYAKVARAHGSEATVEDSPLEVGNDSTHNSLTREQLVASAVAIAEEIQSKTIREANGNVYWIGLGSIPNTDRFQLQPLNESFYEGNCGIALFLSALAKITGRHQYGELALNALHSFRKFLSTSDLQISQKLAKKIGIGGLTGLGSSVYCLVKISQFLEETALLEDAKAVAKLMTDELITTDQKFDVMTGSSAAILGLLTLYHATREEVILEKAIACGQHLLKHPLRIENSPKAKKKLLTGFAQGFAGIAYALLQLYAATNDSNYLDAALESIAYERSVFSTSATNTPNFHPSPEQNGQPRLRGSWCHGVAGIALGRLGALSVLQTEEIEQDLQVALQTTQEYGLNAVDNLCCGNFGCIEVLLLASEKLSRPELREIALQRAAFLIAKAQQTGGYQLFSNLPTHVFHPSFFLGTAGIGYELLRLAHPEILPSVLLLE